MGTEQILFSASMVVAFLSGVIALFAPCCITFILPAYLGQILRVRAKILLGTFLFGLGIATVMLPIALGFRIIVTFFQEFHTLVYVLGGFMMIFFGIWTLRGKEINLPFIRSPRISGKIEMGSLYGLGIFGGLTSACCAPVLMGAIILAGLSATLLRTVLVGFAYVAGIVFPLFVGALLWESNPLQPVRSFLARPISVKFLRIRKEICLGNLVSGLALIILGFALAVLASLDKIAMPEETSATGAIISRVVLNVGLILKNNPYLEYVFLVLLVVFVFILARKIRKDKKNNHCLHK